MTNVRRPFGQSVWMACLSESLDVWDERRIALYLELNCDVFTYLLLFS